MPFCQLVCGPPGSGKSTYCRGLQQFFALCGRPCAVVNLDPGNEDAPYEAQIDVADLVSLPVVMEELGLGPNGGLLYCMETLEKNLEWLKERLAPLGESTYVLFDFPGQAELFSCHGSVQRIARTVVNDWGFRAAAVHLVDSHVCADPHKYLSAVVLSLTAMLHLELPHVNVLTKMDLFTKHVPDGDPEATVAEYTGPSGMDFVRGALAGADDPFSRSHARLTDALCEVVEDFSLVSFATLHVENAKSVKRSVKWHAHEGLVRTIDKCNGYAMAGIELERFDQIHGLSAQTDDPAEAALEDGLFDANAGESIDEMARAIAARAGGRTRGASGPDSDHDDGYDGGH